MKLRIMVGLLVLLLGITGFTLYRDSHGATETPDHVYEPSMQTISEEGGGQVDERVDRAPGHHQA